MAVHVFLSWLLLLLLCVFISNVIAAIQLSVGSNCEGGSKVHTVNEDKSYELVWSHGKVPKYCTFTFKPIGEDILDDYKICVDVSSFNLEHCDLEVLYYIRFGIHPDKTYKCGDKPSKVCGEKDKNFKVELTTKSFDRSTYPSSTNNFKLSVTAVKLYDHTSILVTIYAIAGGVLGGIALISIIVVIACICICNRRHRARSVRRLLNTTHTGGQTNIAMTTVLQPYQHGNQPYPTQTYTIQTYPPPMSGQQPTAPPSCSSIQTPQGENITVPTEPASNKM